MHAVSIIDSLDWMRAAARKEFSGRLLGHPTVLNLSDSCWDFCFDYCNRTRPKWLLKIVTRQSNTLY